MSYPRYLPGAILICLAISAAWLYQDVVLYATLKYGTDIELQGDALGYYELAMTKRAFYSASLREPLFPYILRQSIFAFGVREPKSREQVLWNHFVVRWTTSWIGIALIALIGILGWKAGGQ